MCNANTSAFFALGGFVAGMFVIATAEVDVFTLLRHIAYVWRYKRLLCVLVLLSVALVFGGIIAYEYSLKRAEAMSRVELEDAERLRVEKEIYARNHKEFACLQEYKTELYQRSQQLDMVKVQLGKASSELDKKKEELLHELNEFEQWQELAVEALRHRAESIKRAADIKNAESRSVKLRKLAEKIESINVSGNLS